MTTTNHRSRTDLLFETLTSAHRRRLVSSLLTENPQDVRSISRGPDVPSNAETASITLRHVHLPKLESLGYIRWDSATGVVTKGPRFDEIAAVVELLDEHRDVLPDDRVGPPETH